jgi:hypothetical protein
VFLTKLSNCLLKPSPHRGDRWEVGFSFGARQRYAGTRTVRGFEEAVVSAGRLQCACVEEELRESGNRPDKTTYGYAPGVGEVRMQWGRVERVLKAFQPVK